MAAANVAFALAGFTDDLSFQLAIAAYTVAAHEPRDRVAWVGAPVALAAGVAVAWVAPPPANWAEVAIAVLLSVGIPLAIGRAVFNRRRRLIEERERAARDAVTEERARIARELHDVVAHAMSVMVVQAGAARTVVERDPAAAADAIRQVEETGRERTGGDAPPDRRAEGHRRGGRAGAPTRARRPRRAARHGPRGGAARRGRW